LEKTFQFAEHHRAQRNATGAEPPRGLSGGGDSCDAYYFRTSDGHEVDLVLDFGDRIWAVEVKLTTAPSQGDLQRLENTAAMVGASERFLVSKTSETIGERTVSLGIEALLERVG
jgi:hypothetical protein